MPGSDRIARRLHDDRGFTLFEILVVLIIIAIASGIVGVYIGRSTGSLEVKNLAKSISSTLRYARNHAVSEKQTFCFVVDREDAMYRLYSGHPSEDGEISPVISKAIPENILISTGGRDDAPIQIVFYPQGNSSGGSIEIGSGESTGLSVAVNSITGKVDVLKVQE